MVHGKSWSTKIVASKRGRKFGWNQGEMTIKSTIIGPFDQRIRRSRCQHCTRSHLKCSGQQPCCNCARKHLLCTYFLASQPIVSLNNGKILTFKIQPSVVDHIPFSLNDRRSLAIKTFFDIFLHKNSFTGREDELDYIRSRLPESEAFLYTTQAIGSLYNGRPLRTVDQNSVAEALQAYTLGNESLRKQIDSASDDDWVSIMESTLFMGLFELIYSKNGGGWRRHFTYGTREVLMKMGPQACSSGAGQQFFLHFRIFEISSSMVFAYRSFLATAPWLELLEHVWPDNTFVRRNLKERMLDLCTICSDLCLRAADFIFELPNPVSSEDIEQLHALATEGIRMRLLLSRWRKSAESSKIGVTPAEMTMAWAMYHTISLYLHNSFEVNSKWMELNIVTPTLHPAIVKSHITGVINTTSDAIFSSNLSAVIFTLPLWIAGNSSASQDQREKIITLFNHIQQRYYSAQMSIWNLSESWARDEIFDRKDCPYPIMKHHRYGLLGHLESEIPNPRAAQLLQE